MATRALGELARLYGVQTAYRNAAGLHTNSSAESVLSVLRSLGAELEGSAGVDGAIRARRRELATRFVEPVNVAWEGRRLVLDLRVPLGIADAPLGIVVRLENGEEFSCRCRDAETALRCETEVDDERYVVRRVCLPGEMPLGYHRARLECGGRSGETLIVAAPRQAVEPEANQWGVFLPLYSLWSERSRGPGDYTDLAALREWAGSLGAAVVGTLPLLPLFLDEPYDPSPYAAVSRLFWNELYVDPTAEPEFGHCAPTRELIGSSEFRSELAAVRTGELVDYRRAFRLKRRVLDAAARCCKEHFPQRRNALERFAAEHPEARDYAAFRAVCDRHRAAWGSWPERIRANGILETDYDSQAADTYLYAQWLAAAQVKRSGGSGSAGLYLDLPIGAHAEGFDTWMNRGLYSRGVSVGAPPDALFALGQNWGSPPLHPERIRDDGYAYVRAVVAHHARHASMLRVDHVMGLHRLYWVPEGTGAQDGVYVRYRQEELYAILTLESARHGAVIVGENLGTVPSYVGSAMRRHGLLGMYASYFEIDAGSSPPVAPPTRASLACVNTHDMPPFAAFLAGMDIEDRRAGGIISNREAARERRDRDRVRHALSSFLVRDGWDAADGRDEARMLRALLRFLAASRARVVLANLEDLWLETGPQNVPGTGQERPNWRRKARYPLDQWMRMDAVTDGLRACTRR